MTSPLQTIPLLLGSLICSISTSSAQSLPEGYDSQIQPLPTNANNVLVVAAGLTAWFDGTDVILNGLGQQQSLLSFPTPVFGSFTIAAGNNLLFGESSTNGIWLLPQNSAPPTQPLANLTLNYDAVLYHPTLAIVSAKTSGYAGPDNDLFALDLQTGSTQLLATLPGASGPVAIDDNGDLYYATSSLLFPTPPGQTDVLRFSRAIVDQALASQQVLGSSHAQVIVTGLDSASDLAFDDDGDLLFVDWFNSTIGEIDDATGTAPAVKTAVDYAGAAFSGTGLQFRSSSNLGALEPFQPFGRTLVVHESSFGTLSQLRTVATRSADLTVSTPAPVPAGTFTLQVNGGPANGAGLIAIALPSGTGLNQLTIAGFEQPLFWHMGLLQPANSLFVSFDAAGSAALTLTNPGFVPSLGILTQAAFVSASGSVIGATGPLALTLTQ